MSTYKAIFNESPTDLGDVEAYAVLIADQYAEGITGQVLTNGQILIGRTALAPTASTLTAGASISITNGAGSITINTIQDIRTSASPTFAGLSINGNITCSGLVDGVDVSAFKADYDSKVDQNVKTTASPTHVNLTLTGFLTVQGFGSSFTWGCNFGDSVVAPSFVASATSNQLLLGNLAAPFRYTIISAPTPAAGPRTYTVVDAGADANFIVSEGAQTKNGVLTLGSLPVLSAATATRLLATDASKGVQSVTITNANGTNVSFAGSTLAFSMTQDLQTSASPTWNVVNASGLTITGTSTISDLVPSADATYDIGAAATRFKKGWFSDTLRISGLSASQLVVTNASKDLASSIGTGNSVMWTNGSTAFAWATNFRISASNTVLGSAAGSATVLDDTSTQNTLVGVSAGGALSTAGAQQCTLMGYSAGSLVTSGGQNSAFGTTALYGPTTCQYNSAFGYDALRSGDGATRGTGLSNTAVGAFSMGNQVWSTAAFNTCLGHASGYQLTTGASNVLLGYNAGAAGTALTTGSDCVLIGRAAQVTSASASNRIAIGRDASSDADNHCVLGNSSLTAIKPGSDDGCDLGTSAKRFDDGYINDMFLRTTGGTAAALDHYEEYSDTAATASGIWAASQGADQYITRTGKVVQFMADAISAVANTAALISLTTIPARFRPRADVRTYCSVKNAGVDVAGEVAVTTAGAVTIAVGSGLNFTGSGNSGFNGLSLCWRIA